MTKKTVNSLLVVLSIFFFAAPLAAQVDEPCLQVGDWVEAEPWHNWIGGAMRTSNVRLHIVDCPRLLKQVDFYYSLDLGQTWLMFGSDTNGHEPPYSTFATIQTPTGPVTLDTAILASGEGWSAVFPHNIVPQQNMVIMFRAKAISKNDDTTTVDTWRNYDPTPPDESVIAWTYVSPDTLMVTVTDHYHNLDSICISAAPQQDSFLKGIPGICQRIFSDYHCVPTAAAACLKYFERNGDPDVAGGLSDSGLVDTLAKLACTDPEKGGTLWDDIVEALENWLREHGDKYTIRQGSFNWGTAQSELQRCQDVLVAIQWPDKSWHMMTFNSVVNPPNFDGTIRVDFMDPWTGRIEWGDYNPATGELKGFSGAGERGTLTRMLIICPRETNPYVNKSDSLIGGGSGPDPIPQPVPLSSSSNWFLNVVAVDQEGNAHRYVNAVSSFVVTPRPGEQGMLIPNFYLAQNSPNPFTSKTTISFALPRRSDVTLSVYDVAGRQVVTLVQGEMQAGVHHVSWNGRDSKSRRLEPGTYFCELKTADGFKQTVKMIKVK